MQHCLITVGVAAALALALGCGSKETSSEKAVEAIPLSDQNRPELVEQWAVRAQVAGIKPFLTSPKTPVRVTAIAGLGCLKHNPEATQLLIEVAHGSDPRDAGFAVLALGRQGAPEAKAEIERAFASPNPILRRDACMAIGEYGDKSLYPLLEKASEDDEATVRKGAAIAARRLDAGK